MRTVLAALTSSGLIVGAALTAGAVGPITPVAAQEDPADQNSREDGATADTFAPEQRDRLPAACRPDGHRDARAVLGVVGRSLDTLVEDGTLTADQRDAIRAEIEATLREAVGDRCRDEVSGRIASAVVKRITKAAPGIAAETIGIPVEELVAAIRTGATVGEVATENGVDPETVVEALVAAGTDALDTAVSEGRLPEPIADRLEERLPEIAQRVVDGRRDATTDAIG